MRKEAGGLFEALIRGYGGTYSAQLGIDLSSGRSREIAKWFLPSLLFGARISEEIAMRTYRAFAVEDLLLPQAILAARWEGLIPVLGRGGYARYDNITANKLLSVMSALLDRYGGDLKRLHDQALDAADREARLMALGKGIGPVTVNVFLRELRGVWPKATLPLASFALEATANLGLAQPAAAPQEALLALESAWEARPVKGYRFADLESALVRCGKNGCRKAKCSPCPVRARCLRPKPRQCEILS